MVHDTSPAFDGGIAEGVICHNGVGAPPVPTRREKTRRREACGGPCRQAAIGQYPIERNRFSAQASVSSLWLSPVHAILQSSVFSLRARPSPRKTSPTPRWPAQ